MLKHVAQDLGLGYKVIRKPEETRPIGRHSGRLEESIKTNVSLT
jgi:hypothetical protein